MRKRDTNLNIHLQLVPKVLKVINTQKISAGLPRWLIGKEYTSQCRRHEFDPWSRKTPHAAEQLSPGTTTAEPVLPSRGPPLPSPRATATEACERWSQCFTREATAVRSPHIATREETLFSTSREISHSNGDPAQPNKKR